VTPTAPLAEGWRQRQSRRGWIPYPPVPASSPGAQGPTDPIGVKVELFLGSGWVDITSYTLYRDGSQKVQITRGRGDETSQVSPQTCAFQINNRDGRFSPRNPVGPYYGLIGRNTPIRVSRLQNGIRRYRFYGEVPAWPTTWDISGNDVYIPLQAYGMLRRLRQGVSPTISAMARAYASMAAPLGVTAYWPCEDAATAVTLASGLPAGGPYPTSPISFAGAANPTLANFTGFLCSQPLPLLNTSVWTGVTPVDTVTGGTANVLRFLIAVPAAGETNGAVIARMYTTGTIARLELQYGTGGSLTLLGFDVNGTQLFTSGAFAFAVNGLLLRMSMELAPSGADVGWMFSILQVGAGGAEFISGTLTSASVGTAYQVVLNPNGTLVGSACGHISYQTSQDSLFGMLGPLGAWLAESPATGRFLRLCSEQNINATLNDSSAFTPNGETMGMGYQLPDTFPNLLQQVPDTSLGFLYESRDQLALALRGRVSLYNQVAKLALDFAQHQLSAPAPPVDDDANIRNDVTVTRVGGSFYRQALTSGALSTAQPPAGVGPYDTDYTLSIRNDIQAQYQAGWRLHMGTVDEPRYPQISINLRHSQFTGNLDLMNAALTVEIGDRITVANPPVWMPPDAITQVVQGYIETMGVWEHDITFNCSPEDPYHVAILDDAVLGRADTDGSTLAATYPLGTETSLLVATTGAQPASPLWTTAAGDFPFDVSVSGERMTVTNITGASSPQTFTVTRSVNGVVKGQTSGTDVRLWQPMILSL
jgi:hypothetical protein